MVNFVVFILMGKGAIADEAVNEGIVSFAGQGRDEFGR
jgi:hypothetical protein